MTPRSKDVVRRLALWSGIVVALLSIVGAAGKAADNRYVQQVPSRLSPHMT